MKIKYKYYLTTLIFFCSLIVVFSQNDYMVTVDNDSVYAIHIKEYPIAMVLNVNVYNNRLNQKYEDYQIVYSDKNGKEQKKPYSTVKAFSVNGKRFVSWHARKLPYKDNRIEFDKIVEVQGKTKEQLYTLVKSWLISSFNLTSDAIQRVLIEDVENGKISIKNITDGVQKTTYAKSATFSSWVNYDLAIYVKDDRTKITLSNFRFHYEKGRIFNDYAVDKFDITAENIHESWKDDKGNIYSHLYKGLMMIVYCAEDNVLKNFEDKLIVKEDDW